MANPGTPQQILGPPPLNNDPIMWNIWAQDATDLINKLVQNRNMPGLVTNITAEVNNVTVVLRWNATKQAVKYRIYKSATGNFNDASVAREEPGSLTGVARLSWQDSQDQSTAPRYYWIIGVNSLGIEGPKSQMVTVNARFGGEGSTFLGIDAAAPGDNGTDVGGDSSSGTGANNTNVGQGTELGSGNNQTNVGQGNALGSASDLTGVGQGLTITGSGDGVTAVGQGISATTSLSSNQRATMLGAKITVVDANDSITLGYAATGVGQSLVVGSPSAKVVDCWFGQGRDAAASGVVRFRASRASGTNIGGHDAELCGGESTGSAIGGAVKLRTSSPGSSGSSLNTLADRLTADTNGNIVPGTGALATNATDGFIYFQTCAGTPSGTPTTHTGRVATIYDSTNDLFYLYDGAWIPFARSISGTYTPTITGVTNVDSVTAQVSQYMRVGNVVTVSGQFTVDPTTSGNGTEVRISLPVASNFAADAQCGGTAAAYSPGGECGKFIADTTNDAALLQFTAQTNASHLVGYVFSYLVV